MKAAVTRKIRWWSRGKLKPKKVPGPHGLCTEIVATVMKRDTEKARSMCDGIVKEGVFSGIWKKARLVLLANELKYRRLVY